jgi:hypothetical protein
MCGPESLRGIIVEAMRLDFTYVIYRVLTPSARCFAVICHLIDPPKLLIHVNLDHHFSIFCIF